MKFFFLFLGLSQLGLDRNSARMMFFNFLNHFAIFLGILYSGFGRNGIRSENFILSFSADLSPVWMDIMPEWYFLIFLLFYWEFSIPGTVGTKIGMKFFFISFLAYLSPVWIEILLEWCFLIFWIFGYFFGNSLFRVE